MTNHYFVRCKDADGKVLRELDDIVNITTARFVADIAQSADIYPPGTVKIELYRNHELIETREVSNA